VVTLLERIFGALAFTASSGGVLAQVALHTWLLEPGRTPSARTLRCLVIRFLYTNHPFLSLIFFSWHPTTRATTDNSRWSSYFLNYNLEAPYYGAFAANHAELVSPYMDATSSRGFRQPSYARLILVAAGYAVLLPSIQ
jgi:hypothetical protein